MPKMKAPQVRLIHISLFCCAVLVVILALGEATLPLFGGDRALAGRVYKTGFMVLITGVVAGLVPAMFGWLARFGRAQMARYDAPPAFLQFALLVFDKTPPFVVALITLGGLWSAVDIWMTQ